MIRPPAPGIIWASLPTPALLIDGADRVLEVNPAAELFLNMSERALKGLPVGERIAIGAPVEEILARVRAGRAALFINDVDVGTGERAPVVCNLQATPLGDDPETVLLLIHPRELADRLERAAQVKSAARSAVGMAEMLAHEIKNPLAGISGAAQLLSMNLSGEDLELTDLIVAETRRVVKLLEQVEQFGNIRPPELRAVNIHDVLDRARRSAVVGFAAHMAVIEDYDPSLPHALGDADQLTQVFLNLLKNASEAARGGRGTIRIRSFYDRALRLRRADGSGSALPLQVEIIDDGPGIPPAIAAEIFEPFVSGRENGTGLGLALVSKILSEHGGWIGVESAPGRTVFRISLPVAPKHLERD
ncbi:two-component system sensor histidine kinase NtrB [Phaeovulum sp.]|uniref:two-component system sensor histidine kinase NtrB n=1 Tax=Phaeovulum sp. TaxID=2934796 RepID=UPI00272FB2F5|nr:ATP-binding protein [Phaeovulum sp.]MDP1668292.1 ATP-binding protein [Phaeovulum sp.]MDZ4118140.1 ATP-binding protein [Phaeovulum sp.]